MMIKFKSNSLKFKYIEHHALLKTKHIGDHAKPIIDKISLVAPSPNSIYKKSISNGGTEDYDKMFLHGAFTYAKDKTLVKSTKFGAYRFSSKIFLDGYVEGALLQIGPKIPNGKNPFMRIEFNPNKLGPDGMLMLATYLTCFMDTGLEYFWDYGKVTRVDVAVDLHGVTVGQVRFLNNWGTSERIMGTGGEIETIYMGKSTSDQTKIYNKGKQAKLSSNFVITRVERSIRTQVQFKKLIKMPNKLAHLALADVLPAKPKNVENYIWELFSDSVEKRGPASALNLLPKPLRKTVVAHLKSTACDFWKPAQIWSDWPSAVQQIIDAIGPSSSSKAA